MLFEAIKAIISVLPMFVSFFISLIGIFADALSYLKQHPEFLQAIAAGITIIVGAIIALGAAGIVALFSAVAFSLGAIAAVGKWIAEHWGEINSLWASFSGSIPDILKIADTFERIFIAAKEFLPVLRDIVDLTKLVTGTVTTIGGGIGGFFDVLSSAISAIPGFQMGGVVQETGLAFVHQGEFVVPAGAASGAVGGVTYNVTIPISSFIGTQDNIEELAREIGEILRREAYLTVNTLR